MTLMKKDRESPCCSAPKIRPFLHEFRRKQLILQRLPLKFMRTPQMRLFLTISTHSILKLSPVCLHSWGITNITPTYLISMGIVLSGSPGNFIWKPNSEQVGYCIPHTNHESTTYETIASLLYLTLSRLAVPNQQSISTSHQTKFSKILTICSTNLMPTRLQMLDFMIQISIWRQVRRLNSFWLDTQPP